MPAEQQWTKGPGLTGLQPILAQIRELLAGRLEVQDGVALESTEEININLRMVGQTIQIRFLAPKPVVDLQYILNIRRPVDGVKIFDDYLEIELPSMPNPRFDIES